MGVLNKLIDFGFEHIDIWRSEPMSLAQVGSFHGSQSIKGPLLILYSYSTAYFNYYA